MSLQSLRKYLQLDGGHPEDGVRAAAVPFKGRCLNIRSLLDAPRIIHISDLHFTDKDHTWDVSGPLGIQRDTQDSAGKSTKILKLLAQRQTDFGAAQIVITGDLTDSGCIGGYVIAQDFISKLKNSGLSVCVVPGNHDCCWEGNLFFEDVFKAVLGISEIEIGIAVALAIGGAPPWDAAIVTEMTIAGIVNATITSVIAAAMPGTKIPAALVGDIAALFTIACPVVERRRIPSITLRDESVSNFRSARPNRLPRTNRGAQRRLSAAGFQAGPVWGRRPRYIRAGAMASNLQR